MFDIGWQELLLIAIVALIVIGPKDMPVAMRTVARALSKLRGLSREFQHGVAEMMREAELDELRRKVESAGRVNMTEEFGAIVDPDGRLRSELHYDSQLDIDPPPATTSTEAPPGKPAAPGASLAAKPAASAQQPASASVPTADAAPAREPG
jgi:sec-independent protein translocase protein TatB